MDNLVFRNGLVVTVDGITIHDIATRKEIAAQYSGIPLTEGWFKRFKFTRKELGDNEGHYYELKIKNGPYLIEGDRGGVVSCFLDGYIDCRVFTVHQLQNLYFALTGAELTLDSNKQ